MTVLQRTDLTKQPRFEFSVYAAGATAESVLCPL